MRYLVFVVMLSLSSSAAYAIQQGQGAASNPGAVLRLEDGTLIKMRLTRNLSSADAKTDERVDFETLEEVRVGDIIIIPKGSIAWGTVTEAQAKRRMGRGGKLNVNIDAVRMANGDKAALRAVKELSGGGHTGAMTGAMVATSLVVWPAAPFFLFMHGKDITIPKGTEISAYINGDVRIEPEKFLGKPAATQAAAPAAAIVPAAASVAPPASAAAELSTANIKSTPDGAEISVDGKYVGSTPSSIKLSPGDHQITVQKPGFGSWVRTITIAPSSALTIEATLEKTEKNKSVRAQPTLVVN